MLTQRGAIAVVIGTLFAAAAVSHADVITTPDPGGYQTYTTLSGGEGVPQGSARWYDILDGEAQYTAWANMPISFSVDLPFEEDNEWRVGVTATNWTSGSVVLPPNYENFSVAVKANGKQVDNLLIPASDDAWNTAWLDLGAISGPISLELKWKNDSYSPNVYDANIAIGAVQFAGRSVPEPASLALLLLGAAVMSRRRCS